MVNRGPASSPPQPKPGWFNGLRIVLILLMLLSALVALGAWLVPIEVIQAWAFERAGSGEYEKFEAVGRAEFACWMVRILSPLILIVVIPWLRNLAKTAAFAADAFAGFLHSTAVKTGAGQTSRWRSLCLRAIFVIWGLVFLGNASQALQDCMTTWPYFKFNDGPHVLPNISDSNRDVIRYLREATPENSRIFVVSDQKLYFLSYYLLPRRLYYKVHPSSEFVIAQPFQQRRMEAYTLSEIDQETFDRISPDYILEYFEHPDFVDQKRLNDDPQWISFYRMLRHDQGAQPNFLVNLRRVPKERQR